MADHNREYAPVPRNSGRALKIPSVPGLTAWCDPQCHPETAPEGFIGPRTAFFGTSDVPLVVLDGFGRGHRHINMGHEIHIEGEGTDLDRVLTGFQGPTYPFREWLCEADGEADTGEGHYFANQLTDDALNDISAQVRSICDRSWTAAVTESPHAVMAILPQATGHPGSDLPGEGRYFDGALGPDEFKPARRRPNAGRGL